MDDRRDAPPAYDAPALARLGTLAELTRGAPSGSDDGLGGGFGSISPP